jgi:hypothetical protein
MQDFLVLLCGLTLRFVCGSKHCTERAFDNHETGVTRRKERESLLKSLATITPAENRAYGIIDRLSLDVAIPFVPNDRVVTVRRPERLSFGRNNQRPRSVLCVRCYPNKRERVLFLFVDKDRERAQGFAVFVLANKRAEPRLYKTRLPKRWRLIPLEREALTCQEVAKVIERRFTNTVLCENFLWRYLRPVLWIRD